MTAYCEEQGRGDDGRPWCILIRGHKNPCQTEVSPGLSEGRTASPDAGDAAVSADAPLAESEPEPTLAQRVLATEIEEHEIA